MGVSYIFPEFEVMRNYDRCIACRVCERQCANEVHFFDSDSGIYGDFSSRLALGDKDVKRNTEL